MTAVGIRDLKARATEFINRAAARAEALDVAEEATGGCAL